MLMLLCVWWTCKCNCSLTSSPSQLRKGCHVSLVFSACVCCPTAATKSVHARLNICKEALCSQEESPAFNLLPHLFIWCLLDHVHSRAECSLLMSPYRVSPDQINNSWQNSSSVIFDPPMANVDLCSFKEPRRWQVNVFISQIKNMNAIHTFVYR